MGNPRGSIQQPTLPLGGLVCEVCPYGVEARCEGTAGATAESFIMQTPSVIGCTDSARQKAFFVDLFGTRFPSPQRAHHSKLKLPQFIPEIPTGLRRQPAFDPNTLFSVSLSTLLRENGVIKYKTPEALRRALKLPANARLALTGSTSDYTIERFWASARTIDIWGHIALLNFEFATSMTFSVWSKHPRFDQIYNQDRNFASHDLLLANGVPSIPFLFSYSERDYQEIIAWLKKRTDIQKVAVLAQFHETDAEFAELLNEMSALREDSRRNLQFLILGVSSPHRIKQALQRFSNSTIVTHQPIIKAIMGYRTLPDLRHIKVPVSVSDAVIAVNNVKSYAEFCLRCKPSRAGRSKRTTESQVNPLSLT